MYIIYIHVLYECCLKIIVHLQRKMGVTIKKVNRNLKFSQNMHFDTPFHLPKTRFQFQVRRLKYLVEPTYRLLALTHCIL